MSSSQGGLILVLLIYCVGLGLSISFWIVNYVHLWLTGDVSEICSSTRWISSVVVPILIAHHGLKRNSLDKSGAAAGLVVGFLLTISNWTFLAMLMTFFLTSSKATRFMGHKKRKLEDDFKEGGQRNWRQVLCNGGAASQAACLYLIECGCRERPINFHTDFHSSMLTLAVLGALSAANADTWASELGTVLSRGDPLLITTLRRVPKGTNGGVSLTGLVASLLGGAAVGVSCWLTQLLVLGSWQLHGHPVQWPLVTVAMLAGLLGSLIDSVLGATLQYSGLTEDGIVVDTPRAGVKHISGWSLLDNHSVNLLTTLLSACITPLLGYCIWPAV